MTSWISVKYRLPKIDERVLYYVRNDEICLGYRQDDGTWFDAENIGPPWSSKSVTHWMPLPDPPKLKP